MTQVQSNTVAPSRPYLKYAVPTLLALLLSLTRPAHPDTQGILSPNVDYSPQEVVQIVVDSLGQNGALGNDQGIATVFRFASPGNRANTGPLKRFATMIKRGFSDMLDHGGSQYDEMEITGNTAVQAVWLLTPSGQEVGYAFQLGKQPDGEYSGMWMTEAVIPLGKRGKSGTRI